MKLETFNNRTKNTARYSSAYINALSLTTNGKRVYTCKTSSNGRLITNIDSTEETILTLINLGLRKDVDFINDNDSASGEKTGNFVELTSEGRKKLYMM